MISVDELRAASRIYKRDEFATAADELEKLRAALAVYADASHWTKERRVVGHGETFEVLTWKGPAQDFVYAGPSKGPEYAREALAT